MVKKVLTIAGSDSSGGAGIQADIKTITCLGKYAMSVITSLTAQNTTGVYGVLDASPEFVEQQLECVFNDIEPDSIKIGMVSNENIIRAIAAFLQRKNVKNLVVDPVMISTSGSPLLNKNAMTALITELLPLATIITPNIPEAETLGGIEINNRDDIIKAAEIIHQKSGNAVLIKGGHSMDNADDLLYDGKNYQFFELARIDNDNTHGTGCTLSSAIACGLADGKSISDSVRCAKEYITGALKFGFNIGNGCGPLLHNYRWVGDTE